MKRIFHIAFIAIFHFLGLPVFAMEQPQAMPQPVAANLAVTVGQLHENIVQLTDQFYTIRKKYIILSSAVKSLDTQKTVKLDIGGLMDWFCRATKRVDEILAQEMAILKKQDELPKFPALKLQFLKDITEQKVMDCSLDEASLLKVHYKSMSEKLVEDRSAALFRQEFLKALQDCVSNTLQSLRDECFRITRQAKKNQNSLCESAEAKLYLNQFNNIAGLAYFDTLAWMLSEGAGKSDIIAFVIGGRGCAHQEVPAFLKKIACDNPHLQIVVYSIGAEIDTEPLAKVHQDGLDGQPHFIVQQQMSARMLASAQSPALKQLIEDDNERLWLEQKTTVLSPPTIYMCENLPNIKLVSCFLELPVCKDQAGYAFFSYAFSNYIDSKLSTGSIIFIGNHTWPSLERMPLIANIYFQYKHLLPHSKACNLQLYTQEFDGQCTVYDPLESPDQPIMICDDRAGKLFLPNENCGVHCAAIPYSEFISEKGLQYHVVNVPGKGLMVSHVSCDKWVRPEIMPSDWRYSYNPSRPEALNPL